MISNFNKGAIFQIISPQRDEKSDKSSLMQISEVFGTLACCLSNDALKRRFLLSCLTKSLIVCNFGNTLAMTIFVLLEMFEM